MCPSQQDTATSTTSVFSPSYSNSSTSLNNMSAMPAKPSMVQRAKSTDKTKKLLPIDFQPSEYSVICGNKRAFFNSVGNRRFRVICQMHTNDYNSAPSKHEKSFVVTKVMKTLKDACPDGVAFVALEQGRWWEVSDRTSREKIGTFFRDSLADSYKSSSRNKVAQRKQNRSLSPSPRGRSSSPSRGRSHSPCGPRGRSFSPVGPRSVSPCPRSVSPAPLQQPLPSMYSSPVRSTSPIPSSSAHAALGSHFSFAPLTEDFSFEPTPLMEPTPTNAPIPSPFLARPAMVARTVSAPAVSSSSPPSSFSMARPSRACLEETTDGSIEFKADTFFDQVPEVEENEQSNNNNEQVPLDDLMASIVDDFTPLAI